MKTTMLISLFALTIPLAFAAPQGLAERNASPALVDGYVVQAIEIEQRGFPVRGRDWQDYRRGAEPQGLAEREAVAEPEAEVEVEKRANAWRNKATG